MSDALTPAQIRQNEKLAEDIRSKPHFTADSMNHLPFGSTQRHDLEERIKNNK